MELDLAGRAIGLTRFALLIAESIGLPSPINEVIIAPQDISDDLLDREPPVQVKDGEIGEVGSRGAPGPSNDLTNILSYLFLLLRSN